MEDRDRLELAIWGRAWVVSRVLVLCCSLTTAPWGLISIFYLELSRHELPALWQFPMDFRKTEKAFPSYREVWVLKYTVVYCIHTHSYKVSDEVDIHLFFMDFLFHVIEQQWSNFSWTFPANGHFQQNSRTASSIVTITFKSAWLQYRNILRWALERHVLQHFYYG